LEVALSAIGLDPFAPGFQSIPGVFDKSEIAALTPILSAIASSAAGRRWAGQELHTLLQSSAMRSVTRKIVALLPGMDVLRAVAFRKDADANWFVPPHQDRSIPVPSAALLPGFDKLTRKDGGWQAEAPIAVLQAMRNCRIFVDRTTSDDGPLEVIRGSHRRGRIEQAEIPAVVGRASWHPLTGEAGDLVILSPLLLHRSRRATEPSGRRVLQIECIPEEMATALRLDSV
jgi:ectoine hydroxylase-related dioxygenase (phytanoyl-CoA dioxygenase family)